MSMHFTVTQEKCWGQKKQANVLWQPFEVVTNTFIWGNKKSQGGLRETTAFDAGWQMGRILVEMERAIKEEEMEWPKAQQTRQFRQHPETGQGSRIDNAQDTEQAISNIEYQLTYNDAFHNSFPH